MTVFTRMLTCCCQKRKKGKSWPIGRGKAVLCSTPSLIYVNIIHIYKYVLFFKGFFKKQSGKILCSHVNTSTGLTFPVSAKGTSGGFSNENT